MIFSLAHTNRLTMIALVGLAASVAVIPFLGDAAAQRPGASRPRSPSGNPGPKGRALLVGIERYQHSAVTPTRGGEADAKAMSRLIQDQGWFAPEEVKTLVGPEATSQRIKEQFVQWLIEGSRPGDQILFFYSGHGTQVLDTDGDERAIDPDDDRDEAIAPYDAYGANGKLYNVITDDQFNQWIERFSGRSVVLIFDSCHSGTVGYEV